MEYCGTTNQILSDSNKIFSPSCHWIILLIADSTQNKRTQLYNEKDFE